MSERRTCILSDESAADSIAIRMATSAILLAAVVAIFSIASADMASFVHEYEASIEISEILSHAQHMSTMDTGSRITIDVDIPPDTEIVLGALPGRNEKWPVDASNYYIRTGKKASIYQDDPFFCDIDMQGPAIIQSGRHQLTIESIRDPTYNRIFIRVSEGS